MGVHGIKGELKVHLFFADLAMDKIKSFFIQNKEYRPANYRFHKTNLLLMLAEVPDRTTAESLRGLEVFVKKEEVDSDMAESQTLVGREVSERQRSLGKIIDIEHTACHEVLVVKTKNGKELLIPYVDKFIKEVNNESLEVDLTDLGEDDEI